MAEQYGIPFFETSAKDNINIADAFQEIAKDIKDKIVANEKTNPGPKVTPKKLPNRRR